MNLSKFIYYITGQNKYYIDPDENYYIAKIVYGTPKPVRYVPYVYQNGEFKRYAACINYNGNIIEPKTYLFDIIE